MVLCACNEDHTVVRLVEPPAGALPGDRVMFTGFTGEPATAAQVAKKKLLEKLAPLVCYYTLTYHSNTFFYAVLFQLKTNSDGVACWGDLAFTLPSGVCTAPLPNATVS